MKILIILAAASLVNFSTKAQCNVTTDKSSSGDIIKQAKFEVIYKNIGTWNNGDYSQGATQVFAKLICVSRISAPNILTKFWGMQVAVGASSDSRMLIPRKMVIYFVNNTEMKLQSDTYEELQQGIQMCGYKITQQQRDELKKPIYKIHIIDNRLGQMYVSDTNFGLYNNILVEQANCLE